MVIPHGITPTKVGVVLVKFDGKLALRLTTPCHGELFKGGGQSTLDKKWSISAWCSKIGCDKEWTGLMFETEAVLHFEQELEHVNGHLRWLAGGLGVLQSDLQVTVE